MQYGASETAIGWGGQGALVPPPPQAMAHLQSVNYYNAMRIQRAEHNLARSAHSHALYRVKQLRMYVRVYEVTHFCAPPVFDPFPQ